jgi:hypothetical protein
MKGTLEILNDIEEYVLKSGGPYDAWHIGVTTDLKRSLRDRGVESGDPHAHATTNSSAQALTVMRFLLYRGMISDLENYDKEANCVYVFKKSVNTNSTHRPNKNQESTGTGVAQSNPRGHLWKGCQRKSSGMR